MGLRRTTLLFLAEDTIKNGGVSTKTSGGVDLVAVCDVSDVRSSLFSGFLQDHPSLGKTCLTLEEDVVVHPTVDDGLASVELGDVERRASEEVDGLFAHSYCRCNLL